MMLLVATACVNFDDEVVPEVINQTGYSLKLNGVAVTDTAKFAIDQMVLAEVVDLAGKKIVVEVNFGNGSAAISASNAADKYSIAGKYVLTANVPNTTPLVVLKANVVISKKPVIVDPVSGESVVLVLDSSYVNGENTITYGLKLDINALDNTAIFVEASVPGKDWSVYTNATETVVINGFKYIKWKVVVANGNVRVGWYQYHTVNGLKVKEWASTSTSKFYKEGLPEFTVYNGTTYKLGTAPVSTKVFTLKLEGVTFTNDSNRVSLNTAFSAKVLDEASVLTLADYDFGNGVKAVNVNTASSSYATPGTYKVTATVKTVTPNKVFTTWVVVPKTTVAQTYTLKVNNETVANGAVIKIKEGASLMFKVVNKDGVIVSSKFTSTGSASVVADSKTIVYGVAGNYDMSVETQTDATTLAVKIEVTKTAVEVYTLKINNEIVVNGGTVKITEGTSLTFKVYNAAGDVVTSEYTAAGSAAVVAASKTNVYNAAGTFTMSIKTQPDNTLIAVNIEVTKVAVPVYTMKINNVSIADGATVTTTEGTAMSFKVTNEANVATVAVWSFGEGTSSTSDGRSFTYALSGTYQVSATVGTKVLKAIIQVEKAVTPVYTLKVNNQAVTNGATIKTNAGTSMYLKTVDNSGTSVVSKYDFGDGSSEITDIAAKIFNVAGTYKVTSTYGTSVITVYIEVAAVILPDVFSFKINGTVTSGTVTLVEGAATNIKVVNALGIFFTAKFDLGNGTKVETDNANTTYVAGNYLLSAVVDGQTITKNIVVTPSTIFIPKPEAIVLISSSISGAVINAVIGLRCDAISNMSLSKDTYVAGEAPGINWKDYKLTETVLIDGIRYFKWSITTGAGSFRMSWVQMKDGGTKLYDGNWAFDLESPFWNVKEGLFLFTIAIDGTSAKLAK